MEVLSVARRSTIMMASITVVELATEGTLNIRVHLTHGLAENVPAVAKSVKMIQFARFASLGTILLLIFFVTRAPADAKDASILSVVLSARKLISWMPPASVRSATQGARIAIMQSVVSTVLRSFSKIIWKLALPVLVGV